MKDWRVFLLIYVLHNFVLVNSGYPPIGEEVQAGSVLLPASRRGRYLANIARRQAVDGTGVHFNKDADRLNADAKKKVDVLSEELLPYIIAEQERRVTLYRRVMTAIQNGEKGVTIAEIRNKPPLIIRKGLMYRCPTNRPPREPDGSGSIKCEGSIEPSPIMYDSCLSAEDRELFLAENRYFFCNRHRIEGPDYPKNGSVVIACAPTERTSLNYTSIKCALEDTDDVVVHYRYYPDRTYKFVTELDPDHEMCDHWNPCQIGYIYSLPSQDTATPANELWQVEKIVPEDSIVEFVSPHEDYVTSGRRVPIPDGYVYNGTGKYLTDDGDKLKTYCIVPKNNTKITQENMEASHTYDGNTVTVLIRFSPYTPEDAGTYYLRFEPTASRRLTHQHMKFVNYVNIQSSTTRLQSEYVEGTLGQSVSTSVVYYSNKSTVRSITVRSADGTVRNLDSSQYTVKRFENGQSSIDISIKDVQTEYFGNYFAVIQNEAGIEERIKALNVAEAASETTSSEASSSVDPASTSAASSTPSDDESSSPLPTELSSTENASNVTEAGSTEAGTTQATTATADPNTAIPTTTAN